MAMEDLDARQAYIKTLTKYGVIGLAAAATAPIAIWMVNGIIAWSACALAFLVVANFAPAVGDWFANKRIQAIKAVAEANPIETMQNLFVEKQRELQDADTKIVAFETEIGNFDTQAADFRRQYPDEAPQYIEMSSKMHDALAGMKAQQTEARNELDSFRMKIVKAQAIYRMSLAASRVTKLSQSAQSEVYGQIKEQVAFDAVRTSLNQAFANLNLAVERRRDAAAIRVEKPTPAALPAAPAAGADVPRRALDASVRRS